MGLNVKLEIPGSTYKNYLQMSPLPLRDIFKSRVICSPVSLGLDTRNEILGLLKSERTSSSTGTLLNKLLYI